MQSNEAGEALIRTPPTAFPFVQRFGDVALIALSSAMPPFIAAGRLRCCFLDLALEERAGPVRGAHHHHLAGQVGWRRCAGRELTSVLKEGANSCEHSHEQTVRARSRDRTRLVVGVLQPLRRVRRIPAALQISHPSLNTGWHCEMVNFHCGFNARNASAGSCRSWLTAQSAAGEQPCPGEQADDGGAPPCQARRRRRASRSPLRRLRQRASKRSRRIRAPQLVRSPFADRGVLASAASSLLRMKR
jgi:hypothetical protein